MHWFIVLSQYLESNPSVLTTLGGLLNDLFATIVFKPPLLADMAPLMSLDASGEHYRAPIYWSAAALRHAVQRAIKDAQTLPLPRALSADKIFRPLVREIQYNQYRHMPQGFFPVRHPNRSSYRQLTISLAQISCDLLVLDLSLNYMRFTAGDLVPYAGITDTELNVIALFEALKRDEICEDEVMALAECSIGPALQAAADGYLKMQFVVSQSISGPFLTLPKSFEM
ncbi:hypothetical protein C0995_009030 [Termitomyces sp. Mi166|nr:hypothetical protein C0995_009030 [Termitomyces sp. Mi166\